MLTAASTPRQRLRAFLSVAEPTLPPVHTMEEIIDASLAEFSALTAELLAAATAKDVGSETVLRELRRDEAAFEHVLSKAHLEALSKAYAVPSNGLPAQFLIDGFDLWLGRQDPHRIERMVCACGVHAKVVHETLGLARDKLHSFLETLVFPDGVDGPDWLSEMVARSVAFAVDGASPDSAREGGVSPSSRKRPREDDDGTPDGNVETRDADGAALLTEENIEHWMTSNPAAIPREVLVARRHPIAAGITEFALNAHYSMDELRQYARDPAHGVAAPKGRLKVDLARVIFESCKPRAAAGEAATPTAKQ